MPPPLLFLPSATSAVLSLTAPLNRKSLKAIRKALERTPRYPVNPAETHAAVLFPLCNYQDRPGILFEVRGKLRTHSGEVSCPGGRVDPEDESLLAAALRETHEEVGISPNQVEILGQLGPPELSLGGMRVWPFVGFVHASDREGSDESRPLVSPPLSSLLISKTEVANIFHLPLSRLTSPTHVRLRRFGNGTPYHACEVGDLIERGVEWVSDEAEAERSEICGGRAGRLEVWGLTGWYLNVFMKAVGVYT